MLEIFNYHTQKTVRYHLGVLNKGSVWINKQENVCGYFFWICNTVIIQKTFLMKLIRTLCCFRKMTFLCLKRESLKFRNVDCKNLQFNLCPKQYSLKNVNALRKWQRKFLIVSCSVTFLQPAFRNKMFCSFPI